MKKFTIDLFVNNRFGVLNRITGLYCKRGYNIESIQAGPTEIPGCTKIEIVSTGDECKKGGAEVSNGFGLSR